MGTSTSIVQVPPHLRQMGICAVCHINTMLEFMDPELVTGGQHGRIGRCCVQAVMFADFVLTKEYNFLRPQI